MKEGSEADGPADPQTARLTPWMSKMDFFPTASMTPMRPSPLAATFAHPPPLPNSLPANTFYQPPTPMSAPIFDATYSLPQYDNAYSTFVAPRPPLPTAISTTSGLSALSGFSDDPTSSAAMTSVSTSGSSGPAAPHGVPDDGGFLLDLGDGFDLSAFESLSADQVEEFAAAMEKAVSR